MIILTTDDDFIMLKRYPHFKHNANSDDVLLNIDGTVAGQMF